MTFDELIVRSPKVTLADIIQLFLKGYDDKIYLDIFVGTNELLTGVRIISNDLQPYYEREIEYFEGSSYESYSIFEVHLKKEE